MREDTGADASLEPACWPCSGCAVACSAAVRLWFI